MKRETRRWGTRSASRSSGTGPIRRGQILDLPALMQNLADTHRTGSLVLRGPARRTIILYLRKGNVAAATDGDEMHLGKALVRTGAFDWKELEALREFFHPTAVTLERLLLDQGKAEANAIRDARLFTTRELVCEALTWSRPKTEFYDGPPVPELVRMGLPPEGPDLPTKPLLMTGVYQLDEWTQIRAAVPSDLDVLVPVGAAPEGATTEIMQLVDGRRSVAEIVDRARMGRFEACGVLAGLATQGTIRLRTVDELRALGDELEADVADPAVRDKRIAVYVRAEGLGLDDDAVCIWLAQAYEERGDFEEASARYLRVGRKDRAGEDGLAHLRRALVLRPDDGALKRELIQRLIDQDRYEDAALQSELYVDWLRQKGDPIAALRAAREILEQLDEFEEMLVLQAELSEDAGNRAEAVHLYRRIAEIRLDSDLADEFSIEERADILRRILELVPDDLDSRHRLATLLVAERPQAAIAELKLFVSHAAKLPQGDPRLASAYETLSALDPGLSLTVPKVNAYLDAGDLDGAEQTLRDSLETERPDSDLLLAYERLFSGKNTHGTQELLARALLESGQIRRGVVELGRLAERQAHAGDADAALAAYQTALEYDPFDWETRSALAELLLESDDSAAWLANLRALSDIARIRGDRETAVATLGVFVRESPDDVAARIEWVRALVELGDADAAEALVEFAKTCEGERNHGLRVWAEEQLQALSPSDAPAGADAPPADAADAPPDSADAPADGSAAAP